MGNPRVGPSSLLLYVDTGGAHAFGQHPGSCTVSLKALASEDLLGFWARGQARGHFHTVSPSPCPAALFALLSCSGACSLQFLAHV